MADETSRKDGNNTASLMGLTSGGEFRRVLVDDDGRIETVASDTVASSVFRNTAIDETPAVAVKATAGELHGWNIYNPNAYDVFVKLYNTAAASVVVGTTAVVKTLHIPAGASVYQEPNCIQQSFSTAIAVACTQLIADSDTTAIATDVYVEIYYA